MLTVRTEIFKAFHSHLTILSCHRRRFYLGNLPIFPRPSGRIARSTPYLSRRACPITTGEPYLDGLGGLHLSVSYYYST